MSGFLVPSVLFLIQTDNSEVPVGIVQTLTSCQLFQDLSKNITIIIETMRIYFQQVHSFELNPSFLLVNTKMPAHDENSDWTMFDPSKTLHVCCYFDIPNIPIFF